jgi:hypothetical protein
MRRKMTILVLMCLFVMVFVSSAWCSFNPSSYNFGWIYLGTGSTECSSITYTNDVGGEIICDQNGCYEAPLPTRSVTFSPPTGFTVNPTSATLPGYSSVNLNVCATPYSGEGNNTGNLIATYSPPYVLNGNSWTTENMSLQIKEINTLVTLEPLYTTLAFPQTVIGQTSESFFYVCNYNSFPVTINSISSDNNNFTVVSGWTPVVQPLANNNPSCNTVYINFSPQGTEGYSTNGNIQVNTTTQNLTYSLSGTGILQNPSGPPSPPPGPAFSLTVIPLLVAGVSIVLYWQGRKQKKGIASNNS